VPRSPIATAILLACPAVMAQEQRGLEEIIVTAQKRTENLQDVPISIQALGNETLKELNVKNFNDYVQMLPTVTSQPAMGAGSGFSLVYMRGIATGADGQATTSQPSVGMYLDEQPITTVQGNLDIHMYDIERVEALAGPQGTLYGASSQAGTIRIITNKPDPSKFAAGYNVEGNMVDGSDTGYTAEGFVNLPIGSAAAVRLVGWYDHSAGWIDNVKGSRTFPANEDHDPESETYCGPAGSAACAADNITINNDKFAEKNYNTADTYGARAALKVNLGDNWSITPTAQYQNQEGNGSWADDLNNVLSGGDQSVVHFKPEFSNDKWYQLGLTVEGKIGNFDLVYSGNYLDRTVDASFDYADYSYWYDTYYTTGLYSSLHFDDNGDPIPPVARYTNNDKYNKTSHELRLSSPADNRLRGMIGLFYQVQKHAFEQRFQVEGLALQMQMNRDEPNGNRFPDTVYLNNLDRKDTDKAIFGSLSFDLTDKIELTAGLRYFEPEVTVKGFFGFGLGFTEMGWSSTGENRCNLFPNGQQDYKDTPCLNVDKGIKESEHVGRLNVNYKATDDVLLYATWSEGYRPGGINRNPFAGDFKSDFLTNWEVGWKTAWMNNSLQFNGAVFYEQWKDFQISFLGANGITQVANGPTADVMGTELQLLWQATDNLRISGAAAYYDSELKDPYADYDEDGNIVEILAPKGSPLPITPDFKANLVARYDFAAGDFNPYVQGALAYETSRPSDIRPDVSKFVGEIPSATVLNVAMGLAQDRYSLELYVENLTNENAPLAINTQCTVSVCGAQPYGVRRRPITIGLRFSQEF
jgi:outer membrane receptor protein involved in Fe transport